MLAPEAKTVKIDVCVRRERDGAFVYEGSSIWEACKEGSMDTLVVHLLSQSFDCSNEIDSFDDAGAAPIHYAAQSGDFPIVRKLLEHGADVNKHDATGKTPLMWAAGAGRTVMVSELLTLNVALDHRDHDGCTVFHHAAAGSSTTLHCLLQMTRQRDVAVSHEELYLHACREGAYFSVCYCLEQLAVDPLHVSPVADGDTALHIAAANDRTDVAGLLASKVPELITAANGRGETPTSVRGASSATVRAIRTRREHPDVSNWDAVVNTGTLKDVAVPMVAPNLIILAMGQITGPYAFLGAFVVLFSMVRLAQGVARKMSMRAGSHPGFAGWYFGALIYGSAVMFLVVFPHVDHPHLKAVWWANTGVMFVAYACAVLGDPGVIMSTVDDRQNIYAAMSPLGDVCGKTYFLSPMVRRLPRSKFCSTKQQPIHRFDHYCGWTYNTIGGGNYRWFVLFVLTQVICHVFVAYFTFVMYRGHPSCPTADLHSPWTWIDYLFAPEMLLTTYTTVFYNGACLAFAGMMAVQHLGYISRNITSNEAWFPDRYDWVFRLGTRAYTLYDGGFVHNWHEFLFGDLCGARTTPLLNAYLTKKVTEFNEWQERRDARRMRVLQNVQGNPGVAPHAGHSHGGKKCCSSHGASAGGAPTGGQAQAAQAMLNTLQGTAGSGLVDKVKSGDYTTTRDPETGMMLPSMLSQQILAMPYEQRRKMAERQKQQFASLGLVDATGNISGIESQQQMHNVQEFMRDFGKKLQNNGGAATVATLTRELGTTAPQAAAAGVAPAPTVSAAHSTPDASAALRSRSTGPKAD